MVADLGGIGKGRDKRKDPPFGRSFQQLWAGNILVYVIIGAGPGGGKGIRTPGKQFDKNVAAPSCPHQRPAVMRIVWCDYPKMKCD